MQGTLIATAISYAFATYFRFREKVAGSPMKNHSRASLIIGFILNLVLFYLITSGSETTSELQINSFLITGSLSLALCTIAVEMGMKENYFSIFSLPVCLVVLLMSLLVTGKITGQHFSQPWFAAHLIASISGECFFIIAAVSSGTYLYIVRRLKKKNRLKAVFLFPPLNRLDDLTFKLIVSGFVTFVIGLAIGIYGNYSYFSAFTPTMKHYFSVLVLTYYFVIIALRWKFSLAGPRLAAAALLGFILSMGLIFLPANDLHWQPNQTSISTEVAK